jgi:hypothetical protein
MLAPAALAMPRIWLVPADDAPLQPSGTGADFSELFAPDARWPEQLPQVRVFKVYGGFASNASNAELMKMFAFLRAHHIKLALEHGVLSDNPVCGVGVEGYHGQYLAPIAKHFKALGGTIDYLAMDEPLFYGNVYSGRSACHASLQSLAADAARNIAAMRAVMPNLQVGEVDVANVPLPQGVWALRMAHWAQAFQSSTGQKLAFMHLDVIWGRPWLGYVAAISKTMRQVGIPFGVIFNGNPQSPDDASWANTAQQHYMILQNAGIIPDDAIFQTWVEHPRSALPVNDPTSMTGIVRVYVQQFKAHQGG